MRYLFICLAALLLFAAPAFALANTVVPVTVTVDVPEIGIFQVTNPGLYQFGAVCGDQDIPGAIPYYINTNMTGTVTAAWAPVAWNANLTFYLWKAPAYVLPGAWSWVFAPGTDDALSSWGSKVHLTWPVAPGGYSGTCTFTCVWS